MARRPLTFRLAALGHMLLATAVLLVAVWLLWGWRTGSPCVPGADPRDSYLIMACAFAEAMIWFAALASAIIAPPYLFAGLQFWAGRAAPLRVAYRVAITATGLQLFLILWAASALVTNPGLRGEPQYRLLALYAVALGVLTVPLFSAGARRFVWSDESEPA